MAHYAKYAISACGAMMHHYRRDREATLERGNIDRERTGGNYRLGPDGSIEDIQRRVREVGEAAGRAVRSDAVTMCDWVVTVPPDVREEDRRSFFEGTYEFVRDRYGEGNMLGGWVHMDEATPHMHCAFMPVIEHADGRPAFSAKALVDRRDLRTFHDDLSDFLEARLGYRCQILLDDDDRLGRALSRVEGMKDYQRLKDDIREKQSRLERLRQVEREASEANRELRGRAEELQGQLEEGKRELRQAQGRERQIEEAHRKRQEASEEIRQKVAGAQEEHRELEEEDRGLEREHSRLEGIRDKLIDRVGGLRARLERALERAREILPTKQENAAEKASDGLERVRSLAGDLARIDRLAERKLELKEQIESASRSFDEGLGTRIRQIDVLLDGSPAAPRSGIKHLLEAEELRVGRLEDEFERLNEHRLRNRMTIPKAERRLDDARISRDTIQSEHDRLVDERSRLERCERDRLEEVGRVCAPIRAEQDRVACEYDRGLDASRAGYLRLNDAQRRELAVMMNGRGSGAYEAVRDGCGRALRERCEELVRDMNGHPEPERQREALGRIEDALSVLDPKDRGAVFEHTDGIGGLSWDEIRGASRELRGEGAAPSLADSVDRAIDDNCVFEFEKEPMDERSYGYGYDYDYDYDIGMDR